jgi:alkylation response protein AidB-like acyl-CoA dehydrogenase
MCLTEPQAGSAVGDARTVAVRDGDSYLLTGTKIFISGGDHDLTDNIVHLVLCRLADAPAGTKGLSLAVVPKFLPDGRRNAVHCDSLEKKMGIKGSATCQMRFDQAEGWLIGEPNRGLAAMFLMMNAARLHVAMQGLGHLDAATQKAVAYARERVQLRAPKRPPETPTGGGADLIEWHPAMRRILLTLQAQSEGARVLAYWIGVLLDESEQHPDEARRKRSGDLVALLTPVAKAFLTDLGHRGADDALGVFGGYGYVHEYGIEQHVRDSRIALIYEGTNEIQAIDLVMRKLLDSPRRSDALLAEIEAEAAACAADGLTLEAGALTAQAATLRQALQALQAARADDPEAPLRVADDVLHGLGHTMLAWAWARTSRCAPKHPNPAQRDRKREVARFGLQWVLPSAQWRWQRVQGWSLPLPWVRA